MMRSFFKTVNIRKLTVRVRIYYQVPPYMFFILFLDGSTWY